MTSQVHPQMTEQSGVRFALANGALVTALFASVIAGLTAGETELAVVAVAVLAGSGLSMALSGALGVVSWALFTGFVEHGYGQLTFGNGDVERLVVFIFVILAAAVFTPLAGIVRMAPREGTHE